MPRGAAYVSPGQRARNERDSGDPDRNSDDDWQVETSPDSTAASTPDDGRRKNTRKMPTLPGTPAEDAAPFADALQDHHVIPTGPDSTSCPLRSDGQTRLR